MIAKDMTAPFFHIRKSVIAITPLICVFIALTVLQGYRSLDGHCASISVISYLSNSTLSSLRIFWFIVAASLQAAAASSTLSPLPSPQGSRQSILTDEMESPSPLPSQTDSQRKVVTERLKRRRQYNKWIWWTRLGLGLTILQLMGAILLTYTVSRTRLQSSCHVSSVSAASVGNKVMRVLAATLAWVISLSHVLMGRDVMTWRALYQSQDSAWRAHYRHLLDRNIREVLSWLGRPHYWYAEEEDDVDAVASLLGDVLAYRAVGASHLEVVAGLALLQSEALTSTPCHPQGEPAPRHVLQEASRLLPYAIAAYTGWLLDVGRYPVTFPLRWMWRQGIFTPCYRTRWPILSGDNWWRGHAAAFLHATHLPPQCLKYARVRQDQAGEAVFFVAALHPLRTLLVAVRGTESPEDLLVDGLGRECTLTEADLGHPVHASFSGALRFGHAGVVASARELAWQLDRVSYLEDDTGESAGEERGLLSTLLSPAGECHGYSLRIVGHSLGGAVATLTGMRLLHRFPDLKVYGFGTLPCVDAATAKHCSRFVTSVVYHDEFSCRLSVASVMRLRARALAALSQGGGSSSSVGNGHNEDSWRTIPAPWSALPRSASHTATVAAAAMTNAFKHFLGISKPPLSPSGGSAGQAAEQSGPMGIPQQWSSLGLPADRLQTYTNSDYSSLQQYWHASQRWGDDSQPPDGAAGEQVRRRLKSSSRAFGCLCSHFCSCVTSASQHGKEHATAGTWALEVDEDDLEEAPDESAGQGAVGTSGISSSHGLLTDAAPSGWRVGVGDCLAEVYVPGQIVQLVRKTVVGKCADSCWERLGVGSHGSVHDAILVSPHSLADFVVSPSMFLDHLPWRSLHALNEILGGDLEREVQVVVERGAGEP